jgi:hypothetical protein
VVHGSKPYIFILIIALHLLQFLSGKKKSGLKTQNKILSYFPLWPTFLHECLSEGFKDCVVYR